MKASVEMNSDDLVFPELEGRIDVFVHVGDR
jgi:hypothetical protein